jgi:hypothetical protein
VKCSVVIAWHRNTSSALREARTTLAGLGGAGCRRKGCRIVAAIAALAGIIKGAVELIPILAGKK